MDIENFKMEGKWISLMPDDSDDYLVEYIIANVNGNISIKAIDIQDGEEMEISDIVWKNEMLSFKSFMPSTERAGLVQFRLKENGNIESKFTFTVLEELKRKSE